MVLFITGGGGSVPTTNPLIGHWVAPTDTLWRWHKLLRSINFPFTEIQYSDLSGQIVGTLLALQYPTPCSVHIVVTRQIPPQSVRLQTSRQIVLNGAHHNRWGWDDDYLSKNTIFFYSEFIHKRKSHHVHRPFITHRANPHHLIRSRVVVASSSVWSSSFTLRGEAYSLRL